MAMMSESTGTLQAAPATEDAPRALSQTLSVRDAVMITVSGEIGRASCRERV